MKANAIHKGKKKPPGEQATAPLRLHYSKLAMDNSWNLRLTVSITMLRVMGKKQVCALLLGMVFLAAQFHFCADLSAGNNEHFCPFCSTAGVAIAAQTPNLGVAPVVARLETLPAQVLFSTEIALSISPRAPPVL